MKRSKAARGLSAEAYGTALSGDMAMIKLIRPVIDVKRIDRPVIDLLRGRA